MREILEGSEVECRPDGVGSLAGGDLSGAVLVSSEEATGELSRRRGSWAMRHLPPSVG